MTGAESWDERYRQRGGEHPPEVPFPFLAALLDGLPQPPGVALDLASGTGRHALLLASRGWRVTAVDWSSVALDSIRARDSSIETVRADLEAGEFEIGNCAWDLICVTYFLDRRLFPQMQRGLKRGALAVAAFPVEDARPGVKPMNPAYLLRPGELRRWFENGFEILHSAEVEEPGVRRRAELAARRL